MPKDSTCGNCGASLLSEEEVAAARCYVCLDRATGETATRGARREGRIRERERIARARYRANEAAKSCYLSCDEAAAYLRYNSTSGVRQTVRRGELHPIGRGARGTLMFTQAELDRFMRERLKNRRRPRRVTNSD
ncbi:MAG: helix-turn-helix domain-containing protein [Candidatus Eisenbacteria bacterium]